MRSYLNGFYCWRRALAARMIRSAVRRLTRHSAARVRRGRLGAGTEIGQHAVESLVARVGVGLGPTARPAAAALSRAPVGHGPDGGALPQRGGAALAGRGVGVGLGEVAQAAVGVDDVAAGVAQHPGGFGRVHQVVRVAAAVDLGQRLDLAPLVGLAPGGPLVFVPVVGAADPPGLLRMTSPGPLAVPAVAVLGGTPRAAMSARLITGRPLIAGIGATSSHSRMHAGGTVSGSDLVPPSGRPGNLSPRQVT